MLIIGPPVKIYPSPPDDQYNCIIEKCPKCGQYMWISEKKRTIRALLPDDESKTMCWECMAEYVKSFTDVDIINL